MLNTIRKTLLTAVLMIFAGAIPVFAADPVIMGCVSNDDEIKLYVKGDYDSSDDPKFQIGTVKCDTPEVYPVSEDNESIRTLILIDNSISISSENREKTKALLEDMINSHGDGEQFRLATFEKQVEYLSDFSTDYTALERLANTIEYSDQDTYLTNVISGILDDLKAENYQGYTRIVVIADGVDNKQTGMATEDLYNKIKENNYPIYTIGSKNKSNAQALEDMYAISELTHADHCVLDDVDDPGEISGALSEDQNMTVFKTDIPEEAKNGAIQSCQLTISDGVKLIIDSRMPFGESSDNEAKAITEETPDNLEALQEETAESVYDEDDEEGEDDDDEDEETGLPGLLGFVRSLPLLPIIFGLAVILIVIISLIVYKLQTGQRKKVAPRQEIPAPVSAETEFVNLSGPEDGTHMLFADGNVRTGSGKILTITDRKDPAKMFKQALHHPVIIGRSSGCDIVIDYDKSVSGKHCLIKEENGRFFIQDMGSANKTKVNGEVIYSETELTGGEVITLGRVELTVGIG